MIVKTKVGDIVVPKEIEEQSKFWASALIDVCRTEELYALVQRIRDDAWQEGYETHCKEFEIANS